MRTDLSPGVEFQLARVELYRGTDATGEPARMTPDVNAASLDAAFSGVRLTEFGDLSPSSWLVVVRLMRRRAGEVNEVVTGRTLVSLGNESRAVTVLITRDCAGVMCPGDGGDPTEAACLAGQCVDERCSPEQLEFCPDPECDSDEACALEGVPETCGVATCLAGVCAARLDDARCAGQCRPSGCSIALSACALPEAPDVGVAYERTLFVATDGSADGDGSSDMPFATIEQAAEVATPGTEIRIRAGVYAGTTFLTDFGGEPGRPVAIRPDGDVTLDGEGAVDHVLHLRHARHLVVEGLRLIDGLISGLQVDDAGDISQPSEDIVLRNLTIESIQGPDSGSDCIRLVSVDRFWLLGSAMSQCGKGLYLAGCHDGTLSGNQFSSSLRGVATEAGSSDLLIHANRFREIMGRNIEAGGDALDSQFRPPDAPHEAARVVALSNLFVRPGGVSGTPIAFVGCDACVFAHNTIIEPRDWVARVLQQNTRDELVPSRRGVYMNNLIVLNEDELLNTYVNVGPDTAPETFRFERNLWFALDRDTSWPGPVFTDGIPPETDPIIQQDPMLANPVGGDYRVSAGSPAAGAARSLGFPLPPDLDGRCYSEPPTLGAFEAP